MNKQDCSPIKNWQDVERALAGLTGQEKNSKEGENLIRTNDSVNSFLNALIFNLKDLQNQSDISLWFYDIDEPTTANEPYSIWTDVTEHYGDIFYSRTRGRIYQFTSDGWTLMDDATLLKAMALTNSRLEQTEHQRKVFNSQPVTPYSLGDWWIQPNGSLYICEKASDDDFNVGDWASSVEYAGAISDQTGNVLEVLNGTTIVTTDNAVYYYDKATGRTSLISGDSIKTGILSSTNYKENTSGTAFNLNNGAIDSPNFKINEKGEIVTFNQTSLAENKKNIEEYTNALDEIKNIDIYKYNLKNEQGKKHIGFVIGKDYNYSQEVTNQENNGVDLYSFISLCCKAIQEQQQEIEELKYKLNIERSQR